MSVQPSQMFHGKVPDPAIECYNDLHLKDTIIPAIMVHNLPLKDAGATSLKGEAIFNVKTIYLQTLSRAPRPHFIPRVWRDRPCYSTYNQEMREDGGGAGGELQRHTAE